MNYLKKINRNIIAEAAGKGILTGSVIALLINLLSMFLAIDRGLFRPMVLQLGCSAVCALLAVLLSMRKSNAIARRVRSLERLSGPMNNEQIRTLSKDTAGSEHWFLSKRGTGYQIWTKDILEQGYLESSNPAAAKAVIHLDCTNGRKDKVIVTKSPALQSFVESWQPQNQEDIKDEAENLTFGQM